MLKVRLPFALATPKAELLILGHVSVGGSERGPLPRQAGGCSCSQGNVGCLRGGAGRARAAGLPVGGGSFVPLSLCPLALSPFRAVALWLQA